MIARCLFAILRQYVISLTAKYWYKFEHFSNRGSEVGLLVLNTADFPQPWTPVCPADGHWSSAVVSMRRRVAAHGTVFVTVVESSMQARHISHWDGLTPSHAAHQSTYQPPSATAAASPTDGDGCSEARRFGSFQWSPDRNKSTES